MRVGVLLTAALLVGGLTGCSSDSKRSLADLRPQALGAQSAATGIRAVLRSTSEVLHAGTRLVTVREGGTKVLEYREEIVSDGKGKFSLKPVEALTAVSADWVLRQRNGEGFYFRYRDFDVRDADLFQANYVLEDLGRLGEVAGRPCAEFRVERRDGSSSYELCVDIETSVNLSYVERDASGQVLSSMVYESFDAAPDLSSVVWHQPLGEVRLFDGPESLEDQLGFEPSLPRMLPDSYYLIDSYRVVVDGSRSLKLVFSDGVETAFFLYSPPTGRRPVSTVVLGGEAEELPSREEPDSLYFFRLGDVGVAQAVLLDGSYMAVGKLPDQELIDMIEFSSPAN